VLRGYPPGAYAGSEYVLANFEYRAPIAYVDHGISTLPLYLRRLDGNLFVDYGGAFDTFDIRGLRFFHHGALIDDAQLHASMGAELWLGMTLGYILDTQLRLGYAYGFSAAAVPGGQPYFIARSCELKRASTMLATLGNEKNLAARLSGGTQKAWSGEPCFSRSRAWA
jgi:hypothetical protein